jgi:hypothetical protein
MERRPPWPEDMMTIATTFCATGKGFAVRCLLRDGEVVDVEPFMDADTAQHIRDEAWLASVRELQNVWRGERLACLAGCASVATVYPRLEPARGRKVTVHYGCLRAMDPKPS